MWHIDVSARLTTNAREAVRLCKIYSKLKYRVSKVVVERGAHILPDIERSAFVLFTRYIEGLDYALADYDSNRSTFRAVRA